MADEGVGRVEEDEPADVLGGDSRKGRRDCGADVVADEDDALEAVQVDEFEDVARERFLVSRVGGISGQRAREAEAEEIGGDDPSQR